MEYRYIKLICTVKLFLVVVRFSDRTSRVMNLSYATELHLSFNEVLKTITKKNVGFDSYRGS